MQHPCLSSHARCHLAAETWRSIIRTEYLFHVRSVLHAIAFEEANVAFTQNRQKKFSIALLRSFPCGRTNSIVYGSFGGTYFAGAGAGLLVDG